MQRSVLFEQQLRVAFDAAAAVLEARADEVVLDDVEDATLALDATLAGFTVSRPVRAEVGALSRPGERTVTVALSWAAVERSRHFPTFDGVLELSALAASPPRSQLSLIGSVTVPLGVLGSLGEAAGGTHLGNDALEALLARIADRLVDAVAAAQASSADHTGPQHLRRPRFVADD